MKVADAPKLLRDPALAYQTAVALELLLREVFDQQRLEYGLRGEHAALDGRVDALQPLRVEKARGVADEQEAVAVELRDGVEAARGNRLRAVANHLAAFKEARDERVLLESLKLRVRVEQRIAVVESRHVTEIEDAVLHPVNPPAAVR